MFGTDLEGRQKLIHDLINCASLLVRDIIEIHFMITSKYSKGVEEGEIPQVTVTQYFSLTWCTKKKGKKYKTQ